MKIRCLCKWKSIILKFFIIFFIIFGIMNSINVYAATYDNGKMWYSTNAYYTFNVKGYHNGSLLKTTYADRGYQTYLKIGSNEKILEKFSDNGASKTIDGIQITLNLSTVSGGNYVKIEYTVTNTNSSTKTISLATGADIMIGNNDCAPIENLPGNKGIRMSGDGAQFMFIGRNSYGVTDVDTYWFGVYSDWRSNKYNQSYTYQGSSKDSGMAWSWKNRSIAPGETQKYSVLIGIGELNNTPTINVTSSVKDTYYRGEVVNIQGTVNDVDYGDVVRVKYAVDDGIEYEIDQLFTPNGTETPFDLNFSIPTDLSVGNHVLKIWAVDDKGNMSSPKVVNFNLSPFAPPTVPTYKNITNNSFTVEWGTNGNNAGIIYELYDVISNTTVYSGTETSVTLSGFGPNEMRQYKARSKNDHGQYSDYTSVTTVYTLANQPISKGYDNITSNSVRLLWNPNGNPSYTNYHYEVKRKSDNSLVAQGTVNGTSVTVTGLSGGHEQYRFFVRAINGDGVYTDFTELIIPNLVVYQKSNYAKAEWDIEMLDENVLLYRDGNKVYEGFLSDYDDYEATDKTAPNPISSINVTNTGNIINITFDAPEDNGTTYNYQLKTVKHNGDVISSEVKSVTIISDIKGYSYVIDSNPDTIPDDIVDITTPEINATINPNVKNYVHIKVIDNEGNASEVFHQEIGIPTLTATPKHQENYIKLDWDIMDTSKTYKYDVYKKLDGQSLYEKISSNNSNKTLNDYTGQDVAGPTKPTITNVSMINSGNTIHIEYTGSTDKGSKYYYYVEGIAPNTKVKSNIADATIISGLQGYSIVVDQNPDTIPDNVIETTELSFNINQKFYQKFYVHVVAVDNAGNISEVAHFECTDVNPPTLNITGNATNWTNQDVVLTAVAHDNESGLKGIKLPDDTWVYSDTATFVVTNNGSYTFIAEDNFGNQTSVTVIVNKIDKTPPLNTSIIINNNDLYTNNRDVVLTVSAEDNATDVSEMRFRTENSPWSAWVPYATTYNYTMDAGFTHQGTNRVYVQFKDGVGNVGGDAFDSIIFDNIAPTGEIIYPKNTTNTRSITLTINAYDINPASADAISGLNSVRFRELQDGEVKQDWTSWEQHNFTKNWILSDGDGVKVIEMEVKDNAGNIGKVTKSIVLDTLFIKEALFTDIVNPPLGNPELPTSEVVKVKKGYEFTFIVKTIGEPDYATYTFNGETGYMIKLADNLFTKTLKVDINDDSVNNELLPINITVARNDGAQKTTTLKVHVEGSVYNDFNINLTN